MKPARNRPNGDVGAEAMGRRLSPRLHNNKVNVNVSPRLHNNNVNVDIHNLQRRFSPRFHKINPISILISPKPRLSNQRSNARILTHSSKNNTPVLLDSSSQQTPTPVIPTYSSENNASILLDSSSQQTPTPIILTHSSENNTPILLDSSPQQTPAPIILTHSSENNTPIPLDSSSQQTPTPISCRSTPIQTRSPERRFSPRLHSHLPTHIPKDVCNSNRLSPTLHQNRRLSPRLHCLTNASTPSAKSFSLSHAMSCSNSAKRSKPDYPKDNGCPQFNGTTSAPNGAPFDKLTMTSKVKSKRNGDDARRKGIHMRVKETLRIYNTYYLQFVQEYEENCKKSEIEKEKNGKISKSKGENGKNSKRTSSRPDLKAVSKMKEKKEILYPKKKIGHIPGIDVGYQFFSRTEMVAIGFHSHWLNGIDYIGHSCGKREENRQYTFPIAVAIVMSGQYEDDLDNSDDIIYTGQGGHDLLGSKLQCADQIMVRGNLALKNSMEQSVPIRVIRGHRCADSYSGKIYSYDGLYKVVNTWADKGQRGHLVFKYRLQRLQGQRKLTTNQVQFVRQCQSKILCELPGLVCRDISNGLEDMSIPVTNIFDEASIGPKELTYLKAIQLSESVKLPPSAAGCTCKGNCTNPRTCACAKLNGSDFPYVRRDGGRLVEAKDIVFECGPNCGCGPTCLNRTSQRGIKYHLEVYRTPNKGWAVRSWDFIPSGAPICEYIGLLRRSDEVDSISGNDYIFEIDCWHTMNEIEGRERRYGNVQVSTTNVLPKIDNSSLDGTPEFCIDAGSCGNVARFINHSCEPNLFVQCILSSHHDLRLARVVLFAADNIPAMQELTYDYGYALDSVIGPNGKVEVLPCFCGTSECRKRLY